MECSRSVTEIISKLKSKTQLTIHKNLVVRKSHAYLYIFGEWCATAAFFKTSSFPSSTTVDLQPLYIHWLFSWFIRDSAKHIIRKVFTNICVKRIEIMGMFTISSVALFMNKKVQTSFMTRERLLLEQQMIGNWISILRFYIFEAQVHQTWVGFDFSSLTDPDTKKRKGHSNWKCCNFK